MTDTESGLNISPKVIKDEPFLSLRELLQTIRKRQWFILLVTLVCVGLTLGYSLLKAPIYEASVEILVSQDQGSTTPSSLGNDVQGLQQLTQTLTELVNSRPVTEAVVQQLNLPMAPEVLEQNLTVKQIKSTQLIEATYRDPSPERAQQIANTLGDVFSQQVSESTISADNVTATVWEQAQVPDKPVSPKLVLNVGIALIVGLTLGVGAALLSQYMNGSVRFLEEAEQTSELPSDRISRQFESTTGKKDRA